MNKKNKNMNKKNKKPYKKPEIKRVKLTPEEAVLATCKTSIGAIGTQGKCVATCASSAGS